MLSFLSYFWFTFLYQPLFNALVWIYVNLAGHNLGWAVVWMTILLRVLLLPLTVISEKAAGKRKTAEEEAAKQGEAFKGDVILRKEEIRKAMKKNKISPWAKVLTLGIQLLVLVLLYQVFQRGITGEKVFKILYPWMDYPGKLNVVFFGFDIGKTRDYIWAGAAAVYLFTSILLENREDKDWDVSKATFLFLFPAFTFVILFFLPMVKSLFVLTSMLFSDIVSVMMKVFGDKKKAEEKAKN